MPYLRVLSLHKQKLLTSVDICSLKNLRVLEMSQAQFLSNLFFDQLCQHCRLLSELRMGGYFSHFLLFLFLLDNVLDGLFLVCRCTEIRKIEKIVLLERLEILSINGCVSI